MIRYAHARPRCEIPSNCSHVCSATLQRTQIVCQEFLETYTEGAREACDMAIKRARFFCV